MAQFMSIYQRSHFAQIPSAERSIWERRIVYRLGFRGSVTDHPLRRTLGKTPTAISITHFFQPSVYGENVVNVERLESR